MQKIQRLFYSSTTNFGLDDFDEHGMDAIRRVCEDDPGAYLRIIASLLPKEVTGAEAAPLFENVTVTFVVLAET